MHSHAPANYTCPFCLIAEGRENEHVYTRQTDIIYQTARVSAFVSSHQYSSKGMSVLVIPNEHFENIYVLPDAYGADLQKAKRLVALALKAVYDCAGVSTRQHNEPSGYQDVWHYHEHISPRFKRDLLYLKLNAGRFMRVYPAHKRAEHAAKLKATIAQLLES